MIAGAPPDGGTGASTSKTDGLDVAVAEGFEPSAHIRPGRRTNYELRNNNECNSLRLPRFVPRCAQNVPSQVRSAASRGASPIEPAAMALLQSVRPGILEALHEMPSPSSDWAARQPHARGWLG